MTHRFSRRRLLASSTLATVGALPFVRHLIPTAHAATGPKFLFAVHHPFGVVTKDWYPDTFGRDFVLKKCSAPLEAIRDDIIMFRNLDNAMGMKNECHNGKDQHAGPIASIYTGFEMEGDDGVDRGPGGPSIDSQLAQHLHPELHHDDVVANLGVRTDEYKTNWRLLKKVDGEVTVAQTDPRAGFADMLGGGADQKIDVPMVKPFTAIKDAMREDLALFESALALPERERFQQFMNTFDEYEKRELTVAPSPSGECSVPNIDDFMAPLEQAVTAPSDEPHRQEDWMPIARRHMELGTLALSCGARRIVTLQLTTGFVNVLVRPALHTDSTTVEGHDLSHDKVKGGDPQNLRENLTFHQATLFTEIVQGLKNAPNPSGVGSLFDDSVVLWCSEMSGNGGGGHSKLRVPYTVAAGKNCGFPTGRHVDGNFGTTQMLMRTVCNAFGMPDQPFGSPEFCAEPLGGLFEDTALAGNYERNVMEYKVGPCKGHTD